ncbi:MAG: VanZ family protein [Candidatus Microsaccharimonas sp.]
MSRKKLIINYGLLIVWLMAIFLLSSEPSTISSGRSGVLVHTIQSINPSLTDTHTVTFFVRKAAHVTAYFILGILMFRVVRMYKFTARRAVLLSVALVALYAISDELHQLLVNGRSAEVRDVLIDTIAGTIGVLVTYFIIRKYALRKTASSGQNSKNNV